MDFEDTLNLSKDFERKDIDIQGIGEVTWEGVNRRVMNGCLTITRTDTDEGQVFDAKYYNDKATIIFDPTGLSYDEIIENCKKFDYFCMEFLNL
jgi:glutamate dehydrogenase/leucine dehydrogenase